MCKTDRLGFSGGKRMLEVKNEKGICISCCDKSKPARVISINRDGGTYKGSSITSFSLCNDCLNKLARDFHKFS